MLFFIKYIPFNMISETTRGLQASRPLQSIDHTQSTRENTEYTSLSKFVLLLRQKENVFGTENPPQMPCDYIIYLAGSSREVRFILGSARCQCSHIAFDLHNTDNLPVQSMDKSTHLLTEDHRFHSLWLKGNYFSNKVFLITCHKKPAHYLISSHTFSLSSFHSQNWSLSVDTLLPLHLGSVTTDVHMLY